MNDQVQQAPFDLEVRRIERMGWKPSLPDPRDHVADTSTLPVHHEVDPRREMQPPYDQDQLGSCTANAVAGAIEYNDIVDGDHRGTPSRLFIYYGERMLEGSLDQGDTGAYGRDGFKFCHRVGIVPESEWAYDINRFQERPPDSVWADAGKDKLVQPYRSVPRSLLAFKRVLSNSQTIAWGMTLYESYESSAVARHGIVPMPGPNEKQIGGHEQLIVGYLANHPNHALVRNSWGTGWGMEGYCLIPWALILDSNLSGDYRTIRRG